MAKSRKGRIFFCTNPSVENAEFLQAIITQYLCPACDFNIFVDLMITDLLIMHKNSEIWRPQNGCLYRAPNQKLTCTYYLGMILPIVQSTVVMAI